MSKHFFDTVRHLVANLCINQTLASYRYRDDGSDYRGTVSVTKSGLTCKPWHLSLDAGSSHEDSFNSIELMGGHNYCRNPTHNGRGEDQPWCFTNDPRYVFNHVKM